MPEIVLMILAITTFLGLLSYGIPYCSGIPIQRSVTDWESVFIITGVRYIGILFHAFFLIGKVKPHTSQEGPHRAELIPVSVA